MDPEAGSGHLRKNLARGEVLLGVFFDQPGGKPRRQGQPSSHEAELLRSVLVTSIGALDAFLSDLVVELLPKLADLDPPAKVFDAVAKESPWTVLRAFYIGGSAAKTNIGGLVEAHFEGGVMHGGRAVRLVIDWCSLGLSNSDFDNTDFPTALATLDEWTNLRRRIVHRGELPRMKRADAAEVIDLVRSIGETLNQRAIKVYP